MTSSHQSFADSTLAAHAAAPRSAVWRGLAARVRPGFVVAAVAAVLAGHAAVPDDGAVALAWLLAAAVALGLAAGVLSGRRPATHGPAHAPAQAQAQAQAQAGTAPATHRPAFVAAGALTLAAGVAAAQVSASAGLVALAAGAAAAGVAGGLGRQLWIGPPLAGAALACLYLLGAEGGMAGTAAAPAVALAPFCYGAAFAVLARGGAWAGDRRPAYLALALVLAAILLPLTFGWDPRYAGLCALPFALVLAWQVLPDALWAASDPRPVPVRTALTTAGLAVPALAATVMAGFAGLLAGALVLALMPVAGLLDRLWGGER